MAVFEDNVPFRKSTEAMLNSYECELELVLHFPCDIFLFSLITICLGEKNFRARNVVIDIVANDHFSGLDTLVFIITKEHRKPEQAYSPLWRLC